MPELTVTGLFAGIADGSDFTPADDATQQLRQILTLTPRDTGFGNARFVRNLFEAAVVRQAWRLRDEPGLLATLRDRRPSVRTIDDDVAQARRLYRTCIDRQGRP